MVQFLKIIDCFVKDILESQKTIDESFIQKLLDQGLCETEIEQAFTIIYNLLLNRKKTEFKNKECVFRHLTAQEQYELGPDISNKLYSLQLCGLLSPSDLDCLIYGFFESKTVLSEDSDFWQLLSTYRPDVYQCVELLSASKKIRKKHLN
ncbi:MAG: hypothetical protein COB02_04495 [Candidatus Cloacimonadota bacterium]|nr:MAG: hypothetical protein COB02_04495 [Candidatus Cloacimonadota bacterium]